MKKILFPILMILFVVGGAVAADFLRSPGSSNDDAAHSTVKDSDAKSKKGDDHGKKGKVDEKPSDNSNVAYLKFKRQFVVPVMKSGKIEALVIMNFNLELNDKAPDNAYSLEPKLRDAMTRELLAMSNDDLFGTNLTSAESYETVRNTLLRAARGIMPEGIQDILILDIARQEQ